MAGSFRIKMARQHGEQIARERGFESFPVDPIVIAEAEDIEVVAKPPEIEGVSGGILFNDDAVVIFHSTRITSRGFQRFTIAHELGHYFLAGHPEAICDWGPLHVSKAGFSQGGDPIEVEADHFAAALLMPRRLVRRALGSRPVGLDGILYLANAAESSLTSSAIRTAECSEHPLAIIVSRRGEIAYSFLSEAFKQLRPGRFLRKGEPLPATATCAFNAEPAKVEARQREVAPTSLQEWFGTERCFPLDEEIVGLGSYGYTLTVLSSEELPDEPDEALDEEERLEESWTPRFAYKR